MSKIDNYIENYINNQLAGIKFETNWLDGSITCSTARNEAVIYDVNPFYQGGGQYNYIDKDEKIRNLEARIKELESILEEEI